MSQTQTPPTQWRPSPHWLNPPHVHAPAVEQPSARIGSHGEHAPPAVPHVVTERGEHVVPEQQPLPQVAAEQPAPQTPPSHGDAPQLWHMPPPVPHAIEVVPGWHLPWAQQPDGHVVELHTHVPPTHASPVAHGAPLPHRHAPPAHASAVGPHAPQLPPSAPHCAADERHWS